MAQLSIAGAIYCCCQLLLSVDVLAQNSTIKPGSKVFLQRMGGFEADLTVALIGSNVPLVIVKDVKDAQLEISGRYQTLGGYGMSDSGREATVTVSSIPSGVVLDAFTLRADNAEKLARACAKRIYEKISLPPGPPPAPKSVLPVQPPSLIPGATRLFIQGDFERLAGFTQTLRSELRAAGITIAVVQRGEEYDFNVVFAQADTSASAVVLDRQGVLIVSVVDSGFRVKGVTEGAAKKVAKRMGALIRR